MFIAILLLAFAVISSGVVDTHKYKRNFHHGKISDEHLPSFLRNVSSEGRKDFFEIVRNRKIPRKEIKERTEEWAKKQGDFVLEGFHTFDTNRTARFTDIHKKVKEVISLLPSAHEQVHKVIIDDSLSKEQMVEKLRALNVDPIVGKSLRSIVFAVAHPKWHSGRHHHSLRNFTHSFRYEGSGPLSAVLEHAGKGDGILPVGSDDQEQEELV